MASHFGARRAPPLIECTCPSCQRASRAWEAAELVVCSLLIAGCVFGMLVVFLAIA